MGAYPRRGQVMATSKLAGKLTAKKRNALKASTFGLPSQRKYPMPNKGHAVLAKAYAKKNLANGKLTEAQYNEIVTKANRKLG